MSLWNAVKLVDWSVIAYGTKESPDSKNRAAPTAAPPPAVPVVQLQPRKSDEAKQAKAAGKTDQTRTPFDDWLGSERKIPHHSGQQNRGASDAPPPFNGRQRGQASALRPAIFLLSSTLVFLFTGTHVAAR